MPVITRSPSVATMATRVAHGCLSVRTAGEGFTDITAEVAGFLRESAATEGLVTVFCRHTSASLTIQENADPDVQRDLATALRQLAPRAFQWVHSTEGPDDMPAHVRTMLTDASLSIPVCGGCMALGTWQGIYLIEHRDRPHQREVVLSYVGA